MRKYFKNFTWYILIAAVLLGIGGVSFFVHAERNIKKNQAVAALPADILNPQPSAASVLGATANLSVASRSAPVNPDSSFVYQVKYVNNFPKNGVPVLMYHHVGDLPAKPDPIRTDLTVSTKNFADQIDYLAQHGYQTISTEQLYLASQGKFTLPANPICITFDDGYDDVFKNAVPILLAHKMVGSFGIITQFVGQPDYANWDEIAGAMAQGMEIISHSRHHIDFTSAHYKVSDKENEISGSALDLLEYLNERVNVFIYPYGHNDAVTQGLLQKDGYVLAFTVAFGSMKNGQNLLAVPRVRVHGAETIQKFIEILDISQGKVKTAVR